MGTAIMMQLCCKKYCKILGCYFAVSENIRTFASANQPYPQKGALVQLVRMPACHAGGHEFEPRTHRFR